MPMVGGQQGHLHTPDPTPAHGREQEGVPSHHPHQHEHAALSTTPDPFYVAFTLLPLSDWLVAAGAVIAYLAVKQIGRFFMTRTNHAPAAPIPT